MGEVEWSASLSETNPMLGIGRQSRRQSIGIYVGGKLPHFSLWWLWQRGIGCNNGWGVSWIETVTHSSK